MAKTNNKSDRYSLTFELDQRFLAKSETDVETAKQGRETARQQFHNTKSMLKHHLGQAVYAVKTGKAIANFKKALLGLRLAEKSTSQSIELAEHKADLGSQALDHKLDGAKNYAMDAFSQQLTQISTSFDTRRAKRLSGSK